MSIPKSKSTRNLYDSVSINVPNSLEPIESGYHATNAQNNNTDTNFLVSGYRAALFSGLTTAGATASGAAGAGILSALGLSHYALVPALKAGAAGGALIAIPTAILLLYCKKLFDNHYAETYNQIVQFVLSATISALSGVVGYGLLYAQNHSVDMDAGQFAASTALGAAAISVGITTITLSVIYNR